MCRSRIDVGGDCQRRSTNYTALYSLGVTSHGFLLDARDRIQSSASSSALCALCITPKTIERASYDIKTLVNALTLTFGLAYKNSIKNTTDFCRFLSGVLYVWLHVGAA